MLNACGILTTEELANIRRGLDQVETEISAGDFQWRVELEDVHMNVEARLTEIIGDAG